MRLKRSISNLLRSHWKSIDDIPLENWKYCLDGNFNYVYKNSSKYYGQKEVKIWLDIYDNYIKVKGLTDVHLKHLELLRKKAICELDYVITNERFKLTLIEIEETKLKNMLANGGNGITIEQALVHLGKWIGERVKIKEITASEYFVLLEEFGRANK